jgi:hypothetical protein
MTMEYGLVQGRWWLPVRIYLDATADVGILGSYPVRFEQSYVGYRVQGRGDPALPAIGGDLAADSVASGQHCMGEKQDRCRDWVVRVPRDSAALLASDELQPSLAQAGEVMATDRELADLGRTLERVMGSTTVGAPSLHLPDLSSFRFNRVEGPSFGVRAEAGLGRVSVDGAARLGAADWEPAGGLGLNRRSLTSHTRLGAYRRLASFDVYAQAPGFGSALNAILLGRDEADYLRASGVELTGQPIGASRWNATWRLYGEHQHPVYRQTDVALSRAWDESPFPEVRAAERADQFGGTLTLRTATDDPYGGMRRELALTLDAQGGTFDFARPSLSAGFSAPLPAALTFSLGGAAGTSFGELPVQGLWYIGGPASVRGFRTAAAGGEAFWRARAELARGEPAFKLALFSDAGWVGDRDDSRLSPRLVSVGAGISTLDGIIRLDLAKAVRGGNDWRVDLYLSGGF